MNDGPTTIEDPDFHDQDLVGLHAGRLMYKKPRKERAKKDLSQWIGKPHPPTSNKQDYRDWYRANNPDKYSSEKKRKWRDTEGGRLNTARNAGRVRQKKSAKKINDRLCDLLAPERRWKSGGPTALDLRIQHHLSRGRDAGRIAVWENIPVSTVQEVINRIQANP